MIEHIYSNLFKFTAPLKQCHFPHSDLKPTISMYVNLIWQHEWDENINSKLYKVIPSVEGLPHTHAGGRRDQVVLSCCRIGHSWLTHVFLLKGEPPLECIGCQSALTIKHILLNSVDFMALFPFLPK